MSDDPDHAVPYSRFLVAVRLRLRSSSAVFEASGVSRFPRVRPGTPLGGYAEAHLAAPSALSMTRPTEDVHR